MITIVFGKPGAGKTAYLVHDALEYMTFGDAGRALHATTCRKVQELNDNGGLFTLPTVAPVYSNFPIRSNAGTDAESCSYYIDGFHLGFKNEDVDVMPVMPGSRIYLLEAQRYYNSRRAKDLPDWVSRFYEEHRHFGLNILLDVQRPALIDVNIRELCGCFLEMRGMTHITNKQGVITSSVFHVRRFEDWKYVDRYMSGSDAAYEEIDIKHTGNVFEAYQSFSYFNQFVPTEGDFSQIFHVQGRNVTEDAEIAQILYRQTPPEGFYPGSRKRGGNSDVSVVK